MKNEGFTLVELLAVILILSFIAIIAVPIVLNIITEAKIKSLKISTSEYIRAVNTSLINEEVFNNVKDGLYTITDNGKKIVLGDKEIFINYDGRGLKSGLLLIENSKVTRVLKGLIDDYYARVTDEDIEILKNLNESTLVSGQDFNKKVKELVGDTIPEGNNKTLLDAEDTKVKKIIFLQDSVLPDGITKADLLKLQSTDLSSKSDGSIKGYYDDKIGTIYVYSDGYISCPDDLRNLFKNFQGVEEIELNLIDTSKLKNTCWMFQNCSNLKEIKGIENFDTSQVTLMWYMFYGCSSLTNLDLSKWNTSKVGDMSSMFYGCSSLTELDLSSFDTSQVTTMNRMFNNCSSLTSVDVSNFDTLKVKNMGEMFCNCNNLIKLNLTNFNTEKVTEMGSMFQNCGNLTELDLSNFVAKEVINMARMFQNCSSLKNIKFGNKINTSNLKNTCFMFLDCSNLKEIKGIENFDVSQVTLMWYMFSGCSSLTNLDLSKWNTSKAEDMSGMFNGCGSLTELDISNFDTSQVTTMAYMFQNCSSLISIDVSSFNTLQVKNMGSMFNGCINLTELNLSSFDTSQVTNTRDMLSNCTDLKKITVTTGKWTKLYYEVGLRNDIFEYVDATS